MRLVVMDLQKKKKAEGGLFKNWFWNECLNSNLS